MTQDEAKDLASAVLLKIFDDNKDKGLLSIYLWGSIITSDFNPESSDVDAVGILSDDADFAELDKLRDTLPGTEPRLTRLQINFFYLSELKAGPVRSRLARLHDAEQAVFDFPYWIYVAGKKFSPSDFPSVSAEQALRHQAALAAIKMNWASTGKYGDMGLQYFCKGLAWLCYDIHKLSKPAAPFSWEELEVESSDETKELVRVLLDLKKEKWNRESIQAKLPYLTETAKTLIAIYGD